MQPLMPQAPPGRMPQSTMPQGVPGSPAQQAAPPVDIAQLAQRMPPDQFKALQAKMAGMAPEERAAALTALATDYGLAGSNAQQDMNRADIMRQDTPQGRYAGGVYQAANPLEHISQVANNLKRQGEYKEGRTARDAAATSAGELRKSTMADLLRQ